MAFVICYHGLSDSFAFFICGFFISILLLRSERLVLVYSCSPRLWIGCPDNKTKAFDECAIITAMDAYHLMSLGNTEVFPSQILRIVVVILAIALCERLVNQIGTLFVHKTKTLNISTLFILTDVNVRNTL